MALRDRYIAPDIREDVKLGKVVPITSLPWIIGSLIGSIILAVILRSPIWGLLLVLSTVSITLAIIVLEVPKHMKRRKEYKKAKKKVKDLKQLGNIVEYGAICKYKDKSEVVFLEYGADPWEVSPNDKQDKRADEFTQQVFSILKAGGKQVSTYMICSAEDTSSLERRYEKLKDLPEGSRELEDARIEHHYKESKRAKKTRHIIRIKNAPENKIPIQEILGPFEGSNSVYLGAAAIKDLETWQLTPTAKVERGTKERIKKANIFERLLNKITDFRR